MDGGGALGLPPSLSSLQPLSPIDPMTSAYVESLMRDNCSLRVHLQAAYDATRLQAKHLSAVTAQYRAYTRAVYEGFVCWRGRNDSALPVYRVTEAYGVKVAEFSGEAESDGRAGRKGAPPTSALLEDLAERFEDPLFVKKTMTVLAQTTIAVHNAYASVRQQLEHAEREKNRIVTDRQQLRSELFSEIKERLNDRAQAKIEAAVVPVAVNKNQRRQPEAIQACVAMVPAQMPQCVGRGRLYTGLSGGEPLLFEGVNIATTTASTPPLACTTELDLKSGFYAGGVRKGPVALRVDVLDQEAHQAVQIMVSKGGPQSSQIVRWPAGSRCPASGTGAARTTATSVGCASVVEEGTRTARRLAQVAGRGATRLLLQALTRWRVVHARGLRRVLQVAVAAGSEVQRVRGDAQQEHQEQEQLQGQVQGQGQGQVDARSSYQRGSFANGRITANFADTLAKHLLQCVCLGKAKDMKEAPGDAPECVHSCAPEGPPCSLLAVVSASLSTASVLSPFSSSPGASSASSPSASTLLCSPSSFAPSAAVSASLPLVFSLTRASEVETKWPRGVHSPSGGHYHHYDHVYSRSLQDRN